MDLSKLSDEQVKVALKVIQSAKKYGINPDFALSMVNAESGFKQDAVSPKGAVGVMQLMPETARGLKVNPADIDENIDGGMRLLKELMSDKRIGNDPFKILIGYNTSSETRNKFFESGNLADLPDETVKHVVKVMSPLGENVPSVSITPVEPEKTAPPANPADQYGGILVSDAAANQKTSGLTPIETGAMGAAIGAGAGSVYSAKMPVVRMAQRVGLLPGGKPISPTEAAALAERVMTPGTPAAQIESVVKKPSGGENWQKSLTGISTPGAQMDKSSLDLAKRMQNTVGIGGAPGFTGGTITPTGIILSPQDAAAVQARQQAAAAQAAQNEARLQQSMMKASQPDMARRGFQNVVGSGPVRGALAGLGLGYNIQDAYNQFDRGNVLGGSLATGAAGASGLTLVPRLAPVMGPAAVGLTTAAQVAGDLERGDRQRAAESGLTGLTAMFPRLFGPLGAAVYSGGLNQGEKEELKRRREMPPTITP